MGFCRGGAYPDAMRVSSARSGLAFLCFGLTCWAPVAALAHPHSGPTAMHEHRDFGLEITISDDLVRYDIVLSNGCLNLLVPRERGGLKLQFDATSKYTFLDAGQKATEERAFAEFFLKHNPVRADGVALAPRFVGMEFILALDATGTIDHRQAPPDGHVIMEYPLPAPPQKLELGWDTYSPIPGRDMFGQPVPFELAARLDAYDESRIVVFTKDQPTVTWTAPRIPPQQRLAPTPVVLVQRQVHVPALAIGVGVAGALAAGAMLRFGGRRKRGMAVVALIAAIAGAGVLHNAGTWTIKWPGSSKVVPPDSATVADTCHALLRNIYRAFDFKSESDIYDVLAQSVDGPLLERIYQEVYQSLVAREQGGAVTRVRGIVMLETTPATDAPPEPDAFAVHVRWRVNGVVYHWGHVHERVNEYAARYVLAPRGDRWKLVDAKVDDQRRVDPGAPPASPVSSASGATPP
jgi:DNA-binding protein Fis